MQRGGALLSEGGYGCVFHPEITCKGKTTTDTGYGSKIQRNEFDTRILHSNLEGRPRCDDDLAPLFSGGITGEILDDCGAGNPIASSHENDLSSHSEMDVISMPAKKQEEKGTVQL